MRYLITPLALSLSLHAVAGDVDQAAALEALVHAERGAHRAAN